MKVTDELWQRVYEYVFSDELEMAIQVLDDLIQGKTNHLQKEEAQFKKIDLLFKSKMYELVESTAREFKRKYPRSRYMDHLRERLEYIESLR